LQLAQRKKEKMEKEINNVSGGRQASHMGTRKFIPRHTSTADNNQNQSNNKINPPTTKQLKNQVLSQIVLPTSPAKTSNIKKDSGLSAKISNLPNRHQSNVDDKNVFIVKQQQNPMSIAKNKPIQNQVKSHQNQSNANQPKLKVIPIGGLGEIGKNMTVFEYGNDILVVDCGLMFPTEEMMGIDLVIPDVTYLAENKNKIRAMAITHGHEDHIGAIAYVLPQIGNPPIYASRLTKGLIGARIKESRRPGRKDAIVHEMDIGQKFKAGVFEVEFFPVCHSIPDSCGLVISTPVGKVVHTGDFKIDYTPVDGKPSDLGVLAQLSEEGVLLLMSDSTHVELPGYTASERVIGETIDRIMSKAEGRMIVTTFASLISRIQQTIIASERYGRKVFLVGRGMIDNVKIAIDLGYIKVKKDTIVPVEELKKYAPAQITLITTGSQGEPTSALVKIANKDHRQLSIIFGDTVVLSSSPIPGNDSLVNRTIDSLFKQGAKVIYNRLEKVHVHGHASQEELKMVLTVVKPKFFMPIHGEFRHLMLHAELAQSLGVPRENVFAMEDGDILELSQDTARINGKLPVGNVYVDGLSVGDIGSAVLRSRQMLSRDGIVVAMLAFSKNSGELAGKPDIVSLGFVDNNSGGKDMLEESKDIIIRAMGGHRSQDWAALSLKVRDALSNFYYQQTNRHPMIMPVMINV